MRRQRRANLPPNPQSLLELGELPAAFQQTLALEKFLIYDNGDKEDRVLVFVTRRNLEILSTSPICFLDGTFKVRLVTLADLSNYQPTQFQPVGLCKKSTGNQSRSYPHIGPPTDDGWFS